MPEVLALAVLTAICVSAFMLALTLLLWLGGQP